MELWRVALMLLAFGILVVIIAPVFGWTGKTVRGIGR